MDLASRARSWLGTEGARQALGVVVCLVVGIWVWFGHRPSPEPGEFTERGPGWARISDYLLDGPDAGAWASNANALWLGRVADLDPHRLPVYPFLTAAVMSAYPDVALSGHLVNHLCMLALGPVVFLLGARWMQSGLALGAAVVAAMWVPGVVASQRYGVDPVVALAVPMSLLAAEVGALSWRWAPLAGVVVGITTTTHLTTVGVPAGAVLLCLLRGKPRVRWVGALGLLGGCGLGVGLMYLHYPQLPFDMVAPTLAEGIDPVANNAGRAGRLSSPAVAIAAVQAGLPAAITEVMRFVAATTRPAWLGWQLALVVPWIGLVGPAAAESWQGLGTRRAALTVLKKVAAGLAVGVPALVTLAPLLAFAAAQSPQRYTDNFFPVVLLLVFRGFGLLAAVVSARLGPAGRDLFALAVGLLVAGGLVDPHRLTMELQKTPTAENLAVRQLGALIRSHFPPGGGASCTQREADAYAGRVFCPYSPGMTYAGKPDSVARHLAGECSGEGDIPYVVLTGASDGASDGRKIMDAWVELNGELVDQLELPQFSAKLYAVKRVDQGNTNL